MYPEFRFTMMVDLPNGKTFAAQQCISARDYSELQSVDACSDYETARMVGGQSPSQYRMTKARRLDLAKEISQRFTEHIMEAIESQDTKNGHPQ